MNKMIRLLASCLVLAMLHASCHSKDSNPSINENSNKLNVVTSFTLIADMAREIGGDFVHVYNLVPTGTDPHIYSPLPEDIKAVSKADVLLFNGLNLEGGDNGWFAKMVDSTNQNWDIVFQVTEGIEPLYIQSNDGRKEEINPHAFLDPANGIVMAQNTRDAFIKVDPDNESYYQENAEQYIATLQEMDEQYQAKRNQIPQETR